MADIDTAALLNEASTAAPENALAEAPSRAPATSGMPELEDAQVNVINPEGKLVSIPHAQLTQALDQGYQQATDQHLNDYVLQQKYGTPGQQAIAGLEAAAKAGTFGLSSGIERLAGVPVEDIQGRAEANEGTHMLGEGAGLLASSLVPGVGAAHLLERAGTGAAAALGLGAAESAAAKIGSAAVKGFVENALFQSGDEVSKLALGNPNSVQTAAVDIGLSGLLGAGLLGGASAVGQGGKALWNATAGKQTQGVLKAIQNKLGGVEGQLPDAINDALVTANVEIPASVRAALSEDPFVRQASQTLADSATKSGIEHQQFLIEAKSNLSDAVANSLGYSPKEVAKLENLSPNQLGERIKDSLINKLKAQSAPVEQSYDKISNKFKNTILPENIRADMSDQLARVLDNGASQESAEAKLVNRVIAETANPKLATLEQLRNYTSGIRRETSGIGKQELWNISSKIRSVLNAAEENTLTQVVEKEAPDLIAEHTATKSAYKDLRNQIDDLNDRLRVGAHAGPKTFISALKDMDGETVLNRLNPSGKASIISELSKNFPEVAGQVRQYHLDKIIKTAADAAPEGQILNANRLIKEIDKLSPEMRQFLLPKGAAEKIKAVDTILSNLPEKVGKSGTPQGLDALMSHMPSSAMGVGALLLGHGAPAAVLAGAVSKAVGRDVPDAMRLSLLKFLGSSQEASAPGFKAMLDMIHSTIRAENTIGRAVKGVLKVGRAATEILPESMVPGAKDREKLDKQLEQLRKHPDKLVNAGGDVGHYMPEHATAIGQTTSNAVNYLNAIRPTSTRLSPLDPELPANPVAKAAYNRALDIAQQPLVVLSSIKEGTVTGKDMQAIQAMYPDLYSRLSEKLMNGIMDVVHRGESIPYKTRIGLSMFLGQPLDSSMRPESIMSSQPNAAQRQNQQATSEQGSSAPAESKMRGISKLPGQSMTADQSRSVRRQRQD